MSTLALPIPPTSATNTGAVFTGSIAAGILTVTAVASGTIVIGQTLYWVNNNTLATIVAPAGTGTGGIGTYNLSTAVSAPSQTIATSTGTGASVAVPNLDAPRTFWYASGDPLDQTYIESSSDSLNWVKIGTLQIGGSWSAPITSKVGNVRLNRIAVGPLGGATFIGTIVGTVLTVSSTPVGTIAPGQVVSPASSTIPFVTLSFIANTGGTGGAGTYNLSSAPGNIGPVAFASTPSSSISANDVTTAAQTGLVASPGLGNLATSGNTATVNATPGAVNLINTTGASGSYQLEINLAYRNNATGNGGVNPGNYGVCGSRKLTATVRNVGGTLTVEGQSTAYANDNAGVSTYAAVISVAGSAIVLTLTGVALANTNWQWSIAINTAA